jgi:hypothetical protein
MFAHANRTVEIHQDSDPLNPRKEHENVAHLACWHRRANLGDETIAPCSAAHLRARLKADGEHVIAMLPLFLYEHGGMTMSTGGFSCVFDSGQVGWGYVTREAADAAGFKRFGRMRAERLIRAEVDTYDHYLTGEVYGYVVRGAADDDGEGDELDSCWGYYGEHDCEADAKLSAEHTIDPADDRKAEELAGRATYAGPGAPQ